jgi:hypothetical protein
VADAAEINQAIMEAWDEEEEVTAPPPSPPPPPEEEETEEPETEQEEEEEQPEEVVSAEAPPVPGDEPETEEEEEEGEGEGEEGQEGEEQAEPGEDPEVQAFLAKYQGDQAKALKGAAELQRLYGRQGSELNQLREANAQLQQMLTEAQTFAGGGVPLNEEQRGWVEEAAASVNPGAYIRQALAQNEYELARAVCREWAHENPYEANRAGQYIDMAEQHAYEAAQAPQQVTTDDVLQALGNAMPELNSWWPAMATVTRNLGADHPLVQEARSTDADTAMRGVIGIYEIARASTASVTEAKKEIKRKNRESADGARKRATVTSGATSPKTTETPRTRPIMPGLTMEDLETEFARP